MNNFQEIKDTVFGSTTGVFNNIAELWPNIMGALLTILVGLIIGILIEKFIVKSSDKLNLTKFSQKLGLEHILQKANIKMRTTVIVAKFIKGYVVFMFLMAAAKILNLHQIADFLDKIIGYIPNLLIALAIMLIGIRFGETTAALIETTLHVTKTKTAKAIGGIAKYILVFFALMAALSQLEIAREIVMTLFIGFIAMLALGGGLAFGLGGKDVVKELLEDLKNAQK